MGWLAVIVPVVAAGLVATLRSRRGLLGPVAVTGALATLGVALAASVEASRASWRWGGGLNLTLAVAGPSRVIVVLVAAVATAVIAYAASYLAEDDGLPRLLVLMLGFVAAMELLVAAGDLLTLLVGWDIVAACSWALIGHWWRDPANAVAAGEAYVVTKAGEVGLFLAAGAALAGAGSLSFASLGRLSGPYLTVVAAGVLVAAAAKSAQVPFSPWLFSAMAGPTPVSALLHSATMVAAGAYALIRLQPALSRATWFGPAVAAVGVAGALAGGLVALAQTDLKRALAASTTAQYGLMLVAVGAASTPAATTQLVTHALFKSLLFLGAGVAIHAAGTGHLGSLRVGDRHRWTAVLFGVGVLALAGVPPLGGAFSKEQVLGAAADRSGWLVAAVLAAGLLSALYGARIFLLAFGRRGQGVEAERTPLGQLVAMGTLAAGSVLLGLIGIPTVRRALADVVGGRGLPGDLWQLAVSLALVASGVALAWSLDRRNALASLGLPAAAQAVVEGWFGLPGAARAVVVDPTLRLAATMARFDDRVIDAGIRGVGRVGSGVSRLLGWWGERGVDGVVEGLGVLGMVSARGSRAMDELAIDGAVEGVAGGVGAAGGRLRRLQTGLTHHYYVIVGVGLGVGIAVAALSR